MADTSLETQLALINSKLDEQGVIMKKLKDYVFEGNGVPPLTVRMDRMEQSEAKRSAYINIALGTGITAFVTAIWAKLF